jgi:hypothetical protein
MRWRAARQRAHHGKDRTGMMFHQVAFKHRAQASGISHIRIVTVGPDDFQRLGRPDLSDQL